MPRYAANISYTFIVSNIIASCVIIFFNYETNFSLHIYVDNVVIF